MIKNHSFAVAVNIGILVILVLASYVAGIPESLYLPKVAQGTPKPIDAGTMAFQEKVSQTYPLGSPAIAMARDLRSQGFEVFGTKAVFQTGGFPCSRAWQVMWDEQEGKVTNLKGDYTRACLKP